MDGLLHYGNWVLLEQLGCSIKSTMVAQITRNLKKHLAAEIVKWQPSEELMVLLVLLYKYQNPRLTAEVLLSIRSIKLSPLHMTPLKCFILSSVLACILLRHHLEELDLFSCHLTNDLLTIL